MHRKRDSVIDGYYKEFPTLFKDIPREVVEMVYGEGRADGLDFATRILKGEK